MADCCSKHSPCLKSSWQLLYPCFAFACCPCPNCISCTPSTRGGGVVGVCSLIVVIWLGAWRGSPWPLSSGHGPQLETRILRECPALRLCPSGLWVFICSVGNPGSAKADAGWRSPCSWAVEGDPSGWSVCSSLASLCLLRCCISCRGG